MDVQLWMLVPLGVAALGTAVLTPLVIRVARAAGAVALPRPDRWHQRPTALMGGTAIYAGSVGAAAVTVPQLLPGGGSQGAHLVALWAAATLVFVLGLLDDLRGLSPRCKLVGQVAAAATLILSGIRVPCVGHPALSLPVTVFWIVGITNAVNLLDNMDGAVSGVAAIAALGMAWHAAATGQTAVLTVALCIAGACGGFLLYNFHPARVFMGDCGSLYLGFALSALALVGLGQHAVNGTAALLPPIVLLAIPIFDTTLVTIARRRHGRPVSQGGRDHTSHRLVALGFSEPAVALQLYAGGVLLALLAIAMTLLPSWNEVVLAAAVAAALGLLGRFLGSVPVYNETGAWYRVSGVGYRVSSGTAALVPAPSTEPRAQSTVSGASADGSLPVALEGFVVSGDPS